MRPALLLGALLIKACEPTCTPDLHPAAVVYMPGRACDSVVVLLGQRDRPTLRCTDLFADREGCVAWCGRSDWQGQTLVRVQAEERVIDTLVDLPDTACPAGPGAIVEIAPPAARP
jgi:hypothetical protein